MRPPIPPNPPEMRYITYTWKDEYFPPSTCGDFIKYDVCEYEHQKNWNKASPSCKQDTFMQATQDGHKWFVYPSPSCDDPDQCKSIDVLSRLDRKTFKFYIKAFLTNDKWDISSKHLTIFIGCG